MKTRTIILIDRKDWNTDEHWVAYNIWRTSEIYKFIERLPRNSKVEQ